MLEGHVRHLGVDIVDLLPVAADVEAHVAFDHPVHISARLGQAFFERYGIALGPETGEEFGLIGLKPGQVPGQKRVGMRLRQRAGGEDQHIVEEPRDTTRNRGPADLGDLPHLGPDAALLVADLHGLGLVIDRPAPPRIA